MKPSEQLMWAGVAVGASTAPGWSRGAAISRLQRGSHPDQFTAANQSWLAVVFEDAAGQYWGRAGTGERDEFHCEPIFYGPYSSQEEAEGALLVMYRLGELK